MEQLQSFFPLILLFMVIYLFMIRPQVKKQKQEKNFVSELKKGMKVITKSGMHAKVLDLNEDEYYFLSPIHFQPIFLIHFLF